MANPQVLTVKMIAALLEGIDQDDAKDCEQAIKMIAGLLESAKKS